MLVGCAMYIDVLKAPSLLSSSLQDDGVDIVQRIKYMLKSSDTLQSLAKQDPQQWPTVKLVISRDTDEGKQSCIRVVLSRVSLTACSANAIAKPDKISSSWMVG